MAAAVLLAAAVFVVSACTPEQWDAQTRINETRAEAGLPGVAWNQNLALKAQAWADHLAAVGYLEHSVLADGADPGWWKLGENVGMGPSIEAVHLGFLQSPPHLANIDDPEFTSAGTGVAVNAAGTVFVVQVFGRY